MCIVAKFCDLELFLCRSIEIREYHKDDNFKAVKHFMISEYLDKKDFLLKEILCTRVS